MSNPNGKRGNGAGLTPKASKSEPVTEEADAKGTSFEEPADAATVLPSATKDRCEHGICALVNGLTCTSAAHGCGRNSAELPLIIRTSINAFPSAMCRPKKAGGARPGTRTTARAAGVDGDKVVALEKAIHEMKVCCMV